MNPSGIPNSHSRPPSTPSTPHNDAAYNAALRGASLAFQRTPVAKQHQPAAITPKSSLTSLDNGALIAATSASRDRSLSSSPPRAQASRLSQHTTGSSVQGGGSTFYGVEPGAVSQRLIQHTQITPQSHHLLPPPKQTMADPRSPSFIAATLAASRSGSPKPPRSKAQSHQQNTQQASRRRRHGSVGANSAASSVTSLDIATDIRPIPSANALISMFERGDDDTDPVKKGVDKSHVNNRLAGAKPSLKPVTPPRNLSPVAKHDTSPSRLASNMVWERATTQSALAKETEHKPTQQGPTASTEVRRRPPTPPPARSKGEVEISKHGQPLKSRAKPRAMTPPPKSINRSETVILSPQPRRAATVRNIRPTSNEAILANQNRKPPVKPKPRRPTSVPGTSTAFKSADADPVNTVTLPNRPSSSSSDDTFVSASSAPSTHPNSPRRGRSRPTTPDPPQPPAAMRSPLPPPPRPSHTSHLPLQSLTNAIVAGSLASARMTPTSATPSRAPTPPPARKRASHMRQTLRKPPSKSDDEDEKSRRRSLGKLGNRAKHAHREGSRRHWREQITPRERKRYEGVWASNRGYLLLPNDQNNSNNRNNNHNNNSSNNNNAEAGKGNDNDDNGERVANIVVRDIWGRSRLPFDELSEVWDLVDRRGKGSLDKTEFVVGTWLVDQRLRGRKIPRKVSESVWGSAKGVRVLGPKEDGGKGKGKGKGRV
ncbi:hypothetical protein F4810DRAFT_674727 [Camillea tinctor]|nr:hypothetical protein F4810DRAFT_674727 [Camillea tinctor]